MKKILALLFVLACVQHAEAQFHKGYAWITAGYGFSRPLLKNGYKTDGWQGLHLRMSVIELSIFSGNNVRYGTRRTDGFSWNAGAHLPILNSKAIGARQYGTKGYLIQPFMAFGTGQTHVGNSIGWLVYATPGISAQIPFGVVDFRLNTSYNFRRKEGDSPAYRGWLLYPSVNFLFDGLWETYDKNLTYQNNKLVDISDTTGTEVNTERFIRGIASDVKPFLAVAPRIRFAGARDWRGATFMPGLGVAGRAGIFMADVAVEFGKQGFASSYKKIPTEANPTPSLFAPFDKQETSFTGFVSMQRIYVRGGVDVLQILSYVLFPDYNTKKNVFLTTRLVRTYVGAGIGYASPGRVKFQRAEAQGELDLLLTNNPNYAKNSYVDPRKFAEDQFVSIFASIEVGAVSLSYQKEFYRKAGLANVQTMTLSYMMPLNRILNRK